MKRTRPNIIIIDDNVSEKHSNEINMYKCFLPFNFPADIYKQIELFFYKTDKFILQFVSKGFYHFYTKPVFNFLNNNYTSIFHSYTLKLLTKETMTELMNYAFKNQYTNLLQWGKSIIPSRLWWNFEESGKFSHKNIELVDSVINNYGYPISSCTIFHLIENENIVCLKHILHNYKKSISRIFNREDWFIKMCFIGNYEIFEYMLTFYTNEFILDFIKDDIFAISKIVSGQNIQIINKVLQIVKSNRDPTSYENIKYQFFLRALEFGNLEISKSICLDVPIEQNTVYVSGFNKHFAFIIHIQKSILSGNIDLVKWIISFGSIDVITFKLRSDPIYTNKAAYSGNPKMLKWLIEEYDAAYDYVGIIISSVITKQIEIAKFITEQRNYDISKNNIEKLVHFKKRVDSNWIYHQCLDGNMFDFIQFFVKEGTFLPDYSIYERAVVNGEKEIARWLRENGCPTFQSTKLNI